MTELGIEGVGRTRLDRSGRTVRLRRPALLLAVTILCGAAYLLGIWTGTKTNITCATTAPGQIVCTSDGVPPAPLQPPAAPEQKQSSA